MNILLLPAEEAQLLAAFQKHREKFIHLLNAGVFDLDLGRVEVNINNGQIQNIQMHTIPYKRQAG